MIVVSNTSPISNLANVGQLSLMPQVYGRILIPCALHEELLDSRDRETVITAVHSTHWMDIQSVQNKGLVNYFIAYSYIPKFLKATFRLFHASSSSGLISKALS